MYIKDINDNNMEQLIDKITPIMPHYDEDDGYDTSDSEDFLSDDESEYMNQQPIVITLVQQQPGLSYLLNWTAMKKKATDGMNLITDDFQQIAPLDDQMEVEC